MQHLVDVLAFIVFIAVIHDLMLGLQMDDAQCCCASTQNLYTVYLCATSEDKH